jgi:hypothetical protein
MQAFVASFLSWLPCAFPLFLPFSFLILTATYHQTYIQEQVNTMLPVSLRHSRLKKGRDHLYKAHIRNYFLPFVMPQIEMIDPGKFCVGSEESNPKSRPSPSS